MKISIPQPCSEKWESMTPNERGAFCKVCSKNVIDFTGKSAPEIRDVLLDQQANKQNTCARISVTQMLEFNAMDFEFVTARQEIQTAWIITLMAVFVLTLFSCQNTVSKEIVEQLKVQTEVLMAAGDSAALVPEIRTPEADSLRKITYIIPAPFKWDSIFIRNFPIQQIRLEPDCWLTGGMWIGSIVTGNPNIPKTANFPEPVMIPWPLLPEEKEETSTIHFSGHTGSPQERGPQEVFIPVTQPARTETLEFSAKFAPLPITPETQLIVEAFVDIDLRCRIVNSENTPVFESEVTLSKAVYSLPVPLSDFPIGTYSVVLESALTRQYFDFRISRSSNTV